jgi:hypothetical protein
MALVQTPTGIVRPFFALVNPRQHTRLTAIVAIALGAILVYAAGMKVWGATALALALMLYPAYRKWRDDLLRWGWPLTVLSILVALQGFHTIEHLAQWFQKYVLGWPYQESSGLLSPLNAEIVHFVWNWSVVFVVMYLVWSGLRSLPGWLLLFWSLAHALEHLYLFVNYLETLQTLIATNQPWSLAQGQPGVFGRYGWLSQNIPDSFAFVCNTVNPGLLGGQRLDIHFWWNMWEAGLLVCYATVSMRNKTTHVLEGETS